MAGDDIRVRARIHLLPAGQGGRSSPIHGGTSYRPNHNFFGPDNREMAVGFIELPPGELLHPGAAVDLDMTFFHWPWLLSELYPGREWLIQEGGQVVGVGSILGVAD